MTNVNQRSIIRKSDANVSHLLRIDSQYNGCLPFDEDAASVIPRNLSKGVRLA
jgi:hypothetical protein